MDEFEIFRARAYGVGPGMDSSPEDGPSRARLKPAASEYGRPGSAGSGTASNRSKRRHSSVGIYRTGVLMHERKNGNRKRSVGREEEVVENPNVQDRWTNRIRLVGQVTVAVEPPSPTAAEPSRDDRQERTRSWREARYQHYENGEEAWRDVASMEECSGFGEKQPLHRVQTAPINRSPQTPRRSRSPATEKHRVSVVDEMSTQESDDQTETREPSSPRKGQQPRKDSTKSGSKREVRPDNLLLSTPSHLARRRSSTTCAPESLKPSSSSICPNSPSGLRRNSYTGAVSPMKSTPCPMPVYSTGRRNSAITYLTGSPVRTVTRGHQSPCSPSRRQNNSGELSHVNGGEDRRTPASGCAGLTSEQLRAHLENLARLAANRSRSSSSGETGAMRSDGLPEEDDDDLEQDVAPVYRVMVLGSHGVGKTTLLKQLLTSEYLANKDSNDQEVDNDDNQVAVKLDDEESIVQFIDDPTTAEEVVRDPQLHSHMIDAYIIVYSVNDRVSFSFAQSCLTDLRHNESTKRTIVVLAANKQDLVRNRIVSTSDGKRLSSKRRCKFLEVSALLDHKVDELLVSCIRETRARRRKLELIGDQSDFSYEEKVGCLRRALTICGKIF